MIAGLTRWERQLALFIMVALAVCGIAMAATAGEEAFGVHGAVILAAAVAGAFAVMSGYYEAEPGIDRLARYYDDPSKAGITLFGDNFAACHGGEARGGPGFPDLTASSPLWGNDPATLAETIRVGVNSSHPDSRVSQMPAFGRGGMLSRAEIENVVAYVRSLSQGRPADGAGQTRIAAGQAIFTANCAGCHGENGTGAPEAGAPDLTDRSWLYGADAQSVFTTVWGGRQGHMPSWEQRLPPIDRKILALYLATLGQREQ